MMLHLQIVYAVSERCACKVLKIYRSAYRYKFVKDEQVFLRMRIKYIAAARVKYGYMRSHVLLRREGWVVNHKGVYRLYKEEGLNLRAKSKRKSVSESRTPEKNVPVSINESWAMDFVSDQLFKGKGYVR